MKKFLNEFKAFAMRDNVVDMVVGTIIGGIFGKTVASFMNDIIMPPTGLLPSGVNSKDLSIKLGERFSGDGKTMEAVTVNYGDPTQQTVNFLIIVLCIFLSVRAAMKFTKRSEGEPGSAKPELAAEEKLLTEIHDLLKNK